MDVLNAPDGSRIRREKVTLAVPWLFLSYRCLSRHDLPRVLDSPKSRFEGRFVLCSWRWDETLNSTNDLSPAIQAKTLGSGDGTTAGST